MMIVLFWAWSYAHHVLEDREHGVWAVRLWSTYVHPKGEVRILPERETNESAWRREVLLKPVNFESLHEWQGENLRRRTISDQQRPTILVEGFQGIVG